MTEEKIINVIDTDYIVSSDGKVFSTKNLGRGKHHRELTQRKNHDGYMIVSVGQGTKRRARFVHRLVAEAFIPNPHNLPEVDHIDRNRMNNSIENLRWISSYENKVRTPFETRSKTHKGELNGRARVTEKDVLHIRELYKNGISQSEIAKSQGIGWSTVHNIVNNYTWKDI